MTRPERKLIIQRLQKEGAQARAEGKSVQSMPQRYNGTMDALHWLLGYWDEDKRRSEDEALPGHQ